MLARGRLQLLLPNLTSLTSLSLMHQQLSCSDLRAIGGQLPGCTHRLKQLSMTLSTQWRIGEHNREEALSGDEGEPPQERDWRALCEAMTHLEDLDLELLGAIVISTVGYVMTLHQAMIPNLYSSRNFHTRKLCHMQGCRVV